MTPHVPISVLDLVPLSQGGTVRDAVAASVESARLADKLGYSRLWYAEHHNARHLAASATSVLIGHAASLTDRLRVGAGGVMLPNHSPLQVAETYGTLAQLYPDRIDLGLGRAPGTDQLTASVLSRSAADPQSFASNIYDLQGWLGDGTAKSVPISAGVSAGTNVPIWVLGSTVNGASIAGQLGLPFSFASHFAPAQLHQAIEVYRTAFNPSAPTAQLDAPYVMAGVNVVIAPTDEEARRQWTTTLRWAADIRSGGKPLQPPADDGLPDAAFSNPMLSVNAVGSPDTVRATLEEFVASTGVDELITVTYLYDPADRMRSLELLAQHWL